MAEMAFMYTVATGIFAFLAAILFGARARRHSKGNPSETHAAS